MRKQVYKINENGYLQKVLVKDFDEQGNCTEELAEDIITTPPPAGLIRTYETTRWTGTEWVETMTEEEYIATLPEQPEKELTETEKLRIEQAQANAEIIDLIMAMFGGV